jgi:hypothetical protein
VDALHNGEGKCWTVKVFFLYIHSMANPFTRISCFFCDMGVFGCLSFFPFAICWGPLPNRLLFLKKYINVDLGTSLLIGQNSVSYWWTVFLVLHLLRYLLHCWHYKPVCQLRDNCISC